MYPIQDYALQNFFLNFNLDPSAIDIGYGTDSAARIRIIDNGRSFFEANRPFDRDQVVWDNWEGVELPFLFQTEKAHSIIEHKEDGHVVINYDLLAAIFYCLSGWQEFISDQKDMYSRFPYEASLQKAWNISEKPVVNYYYSIVCQAIEMAYGIKPEPVFKDKGFVTFVSHDIDQCTSGWMEGGYSELKKGRLLSTARIMAGKAIGKDIWFNFDDILAFNQAHHIHATFFFLTRKGLNKQYGVQNADYDVRSPRFARVFQDIEGAGCEVGLQGSLGTGLEKQVMQEDLENLGRKAAGNRCHFLMYDIGKLPGILHDCGLSYDNSTCFAEHIGFRHFTCTPFHLFDFEQQRITQTIELPLTMMDRTFSQRKYMGVPQSQVLEVSRNMINEVKKFNGTLSILWHNHHFSPYKFTGWKGVLEGLINHVTSEGTTFMNGKAIADALNGTRR